MVAWEQPVPLQLIGAIRKQLSIWSFTQQTGQILLSPSLSKHFSFWQPNKAALRHLNISFSVWKLYTSSRRRGNNCGRHVGQETAYRFFNSIWLIGCTSSLMVNWIGRAERGTTDPNMLGLSHCFLLLSLFKALNLQSSIEYPDMFAFFCAGETMTVSQRHWGSVFRLESLR